MYERQTWAEIDLEALASNVIEIKRLMKKETKFCAVVKADGYGHGAIPVAGAVLDAGADELAVAILGEGIELRQAGFSVPILVLGYTPPYQAPLVVAHRLTQTVFSLDVAEALSQAAVAAGVTAKIHLKIDTGMSRIGVSYKKAGEFAAMIAALPGLEIEGVFSHFATADHEDKTYAQYQFRCFQEALRQIEGCGIDIAVRHMANSAAIIDMPEAHLDMVRPGIILYGLGPSGDGSGKINLKPAMKLKSRLAYIKDVAIGTAVSYGCTYTTDRECRIATLPVGYADGWSRALSNKANVWLRGQRAPIIGRICMDQCMVDVTDVSGATPGDEVLLFGGAELPTDEVAGQMNTIVNELLCMVGKRVPRLYIEPGGKETDVKPV